MLPSVGSERAVNSVLRGAEIPSLGSDAAGTGGWGRGDPGFNCPPEQAPTSESAPVSKRLLATYVDIGKSLERVIALRARRRAPITGRSAKQQKHRLMGVGIRELSGSHATSSDVNDCAISACGHVTW